MNKIPLTVRGAETLRAELEELKKIKRPAVIQAIAEAREHGDLKENAEYHAAREQQGFIEGRIAELESSLSNAQIIDVTQLNASDRVVFGCTVELLDVATDKEVSYQIVGDIEADISANRIAISSPIARALIGKEEGDVVVVKAPGGDIEYEIDQVPNGDYTVRVEAEVEVGGEIQALALQAEGESSALLSRCVSFSWLLCVWSTRSCCVPAFLLSASASAAKISLLTRDGVSRCSNS